MGRTVAPARRCCGRNFLVVDDVVVVLRVLKLTKDPLSQLMSGTKVSSSVKLDVVLPPPPLVLLLCFFFLSNVLLAVPGAGIEVEPLLGVRAAGAAGSFEVCSGVGLDGASGAVNCLAKVCCGGRTGLCALRREEREGVVVDFFELFVVFNDVASDVVVVVVVVFGCSGGRFVLA